MIVIRALTSFGYELGNATDTEEKLLKLAFADISWNQEDDLQWKHQVITTLFPNVQCQEDLQLHPTTFKYLFLDCSPNALLSSYFRTNSQFQFFGGSRLLRVGAASPWMTEAEDREIVIIEWGGASPLKGCVKRLFFYDRGGSDTVALGKEPVFV
jgi:hypothetical protein